MYKQNHAKTTKEEIPLHRKCTRFGRDYTLVAHQNALVYLKLRDDGCKRRVAKKFSSKSYCKVDSTKQKDGPIGHRVLNLQKPLYTEPSVTKKIYFN